MQVGGTDLDQCSSTMAIDEESPLVEENPQPLNHRRDVHILCWAFILIFLAYVVVRKLGSKNALVLGTTGYWLFTAANLKPSWYTMVPSSLYMGFAASIIWVGEGTYLTSAAHSHANDYNLHEGTVIGKFNGEFWGMFALHQFLGNLITLAMVRDEKGGGTGGTTFLYIVFLFSMTLGIILMCFLRKRNGKEERLQDKSSVTSVGSLLKSILKLLLDKRILLSSLASGRLTSGLSSITIIVSGGALIQIIVLLWILLKYSVSSGLLGTLVPLLIGALWGIGDGILNTQLSALLGILFKHDLEGAFAQLKLWQSVSIAIIFFISTSISLQTMVVIMLVALCISVVAFLFLALKVERAFSSRAS
ncbi:UNC93-like protein [Striga asiatica]|uniref:UNC93-like protein n=1 Tax=Striga asiatica TaxID=4170 RepID=A0A5A7P7G8_STRAF|nr:UNC93-like protein [Striga asiatica]